MALLREISASVYPTLTATIVLLSMTHDLESRMVFSSHALEPTV
jgi:hypothetical protein